VFQFLGELVTDSPSGLQPPQQIVQDLRSRLDACVEEDATGRPRFSVTLPNRAALDGLAQTLARLLTASDAPAGNKQ